MTKFEQWVQEATEAALAKKNSAHPRNRRVRTVEATTDGKFPPLTRYVRGTCVVIGHMKVTL